MRSMASVRAAWPALALALALAAGACSTPEPRPRDDLRAELPETPRLDVSFSLQWDSISRNDKGERDAEQVARWVTERRNAVERCLRHEPQALLQAQEILEEILSKVSDVSRDRLLLAQLYFANATVYYRSADVQFFEITRLRTEKRLLPDEGGRALDDDEVERLVAEHQPSFEANLLRLNEWANRALAQFTMYQRMRPDDKSVYDYLWKLYFFLQNYEESLRWLDQVLRELDLRGVPQDEPIPQDYRRYRARIAEFVADQRIHGLKPIRPLLPFKSERRIE